MKVYQKISSPGLDVSALCRSFGTMGSAQLQTRAILRNPKGQQMSYSAFQKKYQSQKYVRRTIRRAQSRYGKFAFLNSAQ